MSEVQWNQKEAEVMLEWFAATTAKPTESQMFRACMFLMKAIKLWPETGASLEDFLHDIFGMHDIETLGYSSVAPVNRGHLGVLLGQFYAVGCAWMYRHIMATATRVDGTSLMTSFAYDGKLLSEIVGEATFRAVGADEFDLLAVVPNATEEALALCTASIVAAIEQAGRDGALRLGEDTQKTATIVRTLLVALIATQRCAKQIRLNDTQMRWLRHLIAHAEDHAEYQRLLAEYEHAQAALTEATAQFNAAVQQFNDATASLAAKQLAFDTELATHTATISTINADLVQTKSAMNSTFQTADPLLDAAVAEVQGPLAAEWDPRVEGSATAAAMDYLAVPQTQTDMPNVFPSHTVNGKIFAIETKNDARHAAIAAKAGVVEARAADRAGKVDDHDEIISGASDDLAAKQAAHDAAVAQEALKTAEAIVEQEAVIQAALDAHNDFEGVVDFVITDAEDRTYQAPFVAETSTSGVEATEHPFTLTPVAPTFGLEEARYIDNNAIDVHGATSPDDGFTEEQSAFVQKHLRVEGASDYDKYSSYLAQIDSGVQRFASTQQYTSDTAAYVAAMQIREEGVDYATAFDTKPSRILMPEFIAAEVTRAEAEAAADTAHAGVHGPANAAIAGFEEDSAARLVTYNAAVQALETASAELIAAEQAKVDGNVAHINSRAAKIEEAVVAMRAANQAARDDRLAAAEQAVADAITAKALAEAANEELRVAARAEVQAAETALRTAANGVIAQVDGEEAARRAAYDALVEAAVALVVSKQEAKAAEITRIGSENTAAKQAAEEARVLARQAEAAALAALIEAH